MMFRCAECGSEFEEPRAVQESRGEFWGAPCWETIYCCPFCGDTCFDEVQDEEDDDESWWRSKY